MEVREGGYTVYVQGRKAQRLEEVGQRLEIVGFL